MRALLKSLVLLVVLATLLAGCAPAATPQATQPTAAPAATTASAKPAGVCTLGFINHLTGDGAPYGIPQKEGIQVALDKINANGEKIKVIYEDDRLAAADAQTAFLKLVDQDKVPMVFGSASSTVTLSYCKKSTEKKVVQMSISTNPNVRDCGPYFFDNMAPDTAQGIEWVNMAEWLGVKEAAVIYANNDYGIGVRDSFIKAFEAKGGKILIAQPQEIGSKDFRTDVLKVKQAQPKVVFIVSHLAEASILLKQARELGLEAQLVSDVALVTPEIVTLAGAAVEGMYGLNAGRTDSQEYKDFEATFKKLFSKEPTLWANFAYDQMIMAGKAIEKYGCNSEGIRKGLIELGNAGHQGASGFIKWDKNQITEGSFDWMKVKDGKWTMVDRTKKN